ncbi:hypothetical protein E2542_SST16842 [Spatholobus suberectus]|nr:hypothetical protein E2542_SST16842 [Spatholobus suberectus]
MVMRERRRRGGMRWRRPRECRHMDNEMNKIERGDDATACHMLVVLGVAVVFKAAAGFGICWEGKYFGMGIGDGGVAKIAA